MFRSSQVARHYGKGLFLPVHSNRHRWLEIHSSDGQVWESQLEDLPFKALVKAFCHEVRVQQSQSLQKLKSANSCLHWEFMVSKREAGGGRYHALVLPQSIYASQSVESNHKNSQIETWSAFFFLFKGCEHFNSSYDGIEINWPFQASGSKTD